MLRLIGFILVSLVIASIISSTACALTIGEVRVMADSSPVALSGKVITAIISSGQCYIEEPDRSAGISVSASTAGLAVGDVVDVSGNLTTRRPDIVHRSERYISGTATKTGSIILLKPIAMPCRAVGGADVPPYLPGVKNGIGANNIGLLAKIAGKVTYVASSSWYMDDGSNVENSYSSTPVYGVLVKYPASPVPVNLGDFVSAVGIISGSIPAGWTLNAPAMTMRSADDFHLCWSPCGTISGVVKDSKGLPLPGASVSTDTGKYITNTDSNGAYTLSAVAPGTYNLTAYKSGYAYQTLAARQLAPRGSITADFVLNPAYISPFISNGDFERGFTSGIADGWATWQGSWSNSTTFSSESTGQLAGSYAQRWGRSDSHRLHGGICTTLSVTPGMTYEVIAWLRMDAADPSAWLEAGVDLTGQLSDGGAASVSYTKLEPQGNRKWIRYRKIIKPTGSVISFFTKFGHYSESAGPNWAYVDNVTVQPRMVLECEDYNNAFDTTPGNTGGAYRTGNVDIAAMPGGTGYAVGWVDNGEWLEWTGLTALASDYLAVVNYSGYTDSAIHLSIDGTDITGSQTLPRSGGWDAYRRYVIPTLIPISAGSHTVRLTAESGGCNLDSIELVPLTNGPILQAEDYTNYHDTTPGNSGGVYRKDNVDIGLGSEGFYVGSTCPSEWLEYALQGDGRTYMGVIRYATTSTNASVNLQTNGCSLTGSVALPSTGGTDTWKSVVTPPFTLSTGSNILRLYVEAGYPNINYISLVPLGDGGGGSDLLVGVHFAGDPNQTNNINDIASKRGTGQWLYSTEVYANGNRDPDDPGLQADMTNWIVGYLKPIYQAKLHPVVRIDWIWGETVPRFLSDGSVDSASISKYARTFKKFAQIADANGVPIRTFVVANEMNIKGEATGFTNGYIPEWYYAQVYDAVRTQMNDLGPGYEVLVGGMSPGTFTVDPICTPPTPDQLYAVLSTDSLVYLENVVKELKRRGTQNVGFSLHGYANFDANEDYTNDFMWTIRKQLEIIEKLHAVIPYGQSDPVTIPGYRNAPVYVTEWNRHTPQNSADGRVAQETRTSGFIRSAINQVARFNCNREVYDNVAHVWRTYDPRGIQHNYHPIKAITYFVFDSLGSWGDYSLRDWHTLDGSAAGTNDMYETYQTMIGRRDAAGR